MLPVLSQSEAELRLFCTGYYAALLESFSEKDDFRQAVIATDAFLRSGRLQPRLDSGSWPQAPVPAGSRYVLHLLRKHNLLMEALADPMGSKREDAIAAARHHFPDRVSDRRGPGAGAQRDSLRRLHRRRTRPA